MPPFPPPILPEAAEFCVWRTLRSRTTTRLNVVVPALPWCPLKWTIHDRDEVDVIAGLQRACEHLVRVAGDLEGALRSDELSLDALLNRAVPKRRVVTCSPA